MSDDKKLWVPHPKSAKRSKGKASLSAYTHPRAPHNQPAFATKFTPGTNNREGSKKAKEAA